MLYEQTSKSMKPVGTFLVVNVSLVAQHSCSLICMSAIAAGNGFHLE